MKMTQSNKIRVSSARNIQTTINKKFKRSDRGRTFKQFIISTSGFVERMVCIDRRTRLAARDCNRRRKERSKVFLRSRVVLHDCVVNAQTRNHYCGATTQ